MTPRLPEKPYHLRGRGRAPALLLNGRENFTSQ